MPKRSLWTPFARPGGKRNGSYADWHAVDLAIRGPARARQSQQPRPGPGRRRHHGLRLQVGEQAFNVGRNAVLAAGWPESVPATTIDRQCGSSQQALHFAAQGVMSGAYDIVVAAGVEVMTRVPMGSSIGKDAGFPFGPRVRERYEPVGGLSQSGHRRRDDRRPVGDLARGPRRLLAPRATVRAARATAEGRFERRDHVRSTCATRTASHRRAITADEGIRPDSTVESLGEPEARLQGERQGHRRQLLARSPTAPRPC